MSSRLIVLIAAAVAAILGGALWLGVRAPKPAPAVVLPQPSSSGEEASRDAGEMARGRALLSEAIDAARRGKGDVEVVCTENTPYAEGWRPCDGRAFLGAVAIADLTGVERGERPGAESLWLMGNDRGRGFPQLPEVTVTSREAGKGGRRTVTAVRITLHSID